MHSYSSYVNVTEHNVILLYINEWYSTLNTYMFDESKTVFFCVINQEYTFTQGNQ